MEIPGVGRGGGDDKSASRWGGECVFFGATQLIAIREDTSLSLHMGCTSGRSDENTHPLPHKKRMD